MAEVQVAASQGRFSEALRLVDSQVSKSRPGALSLQRLRSARRFTTRLFALSGRTPFCTNEVRMPIRDVRRLFCAHLAAVNQNRIVQILRAIVEAFCLAGRRLSLGMAPI